MTELFRLFSENIFPIIFMAGVGFLIQRLFNIDPRPLSIVIFYALTPTLIFQLTFHNQVNGTDMLRMISVVISLAIILSIFVSGMARVLQLSPAMKAAFLLSAVFMNAGNYGLSLNSYALGQIGLAWASIFFISTAVLNNSLGVFFASSGNKTVGDSLLGLLRVPTLYAFAIALVLRLCHIEQLPTPLSKPIEAMAAATIPAMLLVLGMQISRTGLPSNKKLMGLAIGTRLILSPLIAAALTFFMNLPLIGRQAGILEAAMPSPVLAIIISMEYDAEPEFVSAVVLLTTILSPLTLTPIMAWLGL
ncbi:MAG: AEC family transporter [Anaerolineales bacterium]|nr:MAG: AEC family transporter [Anaerolineales bacterium]